MYRNAPWPRTQTGTRELYLCPAERGAVKLKIYIDTCVLPRAQLETAKAELGKPFPQAEELAAKSARLAELSGEMPGRYLVRIADEALRSAYDGEVWLQTGPNGELTEVREA